jgi:hypothetical protein
VPYKDGTPRPSITAQGRGPDAKHIRRLGVAAWVHPTYPTASGPLPFIATIPGRLGTIPRHYNHDERFEGVVQGIGKVLLAPPQGESSASWSGRGIRN